MLVQLDLEEEQSAQVISFSRVLVPLYPCILVPYFSDSKLFQIPNRFYERCVIVRNRLQEVSKGVAMAEKRKG